MAITRTNLVFPNEHAPITACVLTNNVAVGDLIIAFVEFGPSLPDPNVNNLTVSDNVNQGNYVLIGQQFASDNLQVNTFFYKIANKAGIPTITTSTLRNTYTGQICGVSYTGFTGIPTPDFNVGLQQALQASGATNYDEFIGAVTSFANSIGLVQFYVRGTFDQPVASGWTNASAHFNVYKIAASANTTLEFAGNYAGTSTGGGALFQLAAMYDFPGTGDDLLSDGRDLIAFDNRWNYCAPATTDWIHVGATGAFCNLNSGGHAAHAFFAGSFTADQQAQCKFVSTVDGARAGIAVRLTAGTVGPTGYYAWFDSAHYNIFVINNGTATSLIGGLQPRVTNVGDVFNLTVRGSTLTLSVNGITLQTVTDTTVLFGNPGIAFDGIHPSSVIAQFRGGSLGANLFGQTITSVVGQISEIASYKPTARTGSFTVGTPTDSLAVTLGGQTASFAEGSLVFVENITGQTASFTEGLLTASTSGNITVNFGAQSSQFAQGQLFDNVSYVLDQGATTAQLFSQTATFVQGNIIAEADYFPLAFTVTSAEGVATTGLADSLGSLTLVSSEGALTVTAGTNVNNTLSAQALTSSEGVISLEADYFPLAQTLSFTEGAITFSSTQDFTVTLSGEFGTFVTGSMIANVISPTAPNVYPNLTGLILDEATQQLEVAGAIVPASIGYFGTWPITVKWVPSQVAPFVVISQNLTAGSPIVPNQPITLTVSEPDKSVAYP